ncbi:hypothetical protein [Photobacterium kishitanii]|uniref:Type 4 secretion system PilS N-terminal domain-containing protein n=1 Tax=Photobacterium kishitanii TaxID=318456 RepID=A0A2T3KM99_9GAMM|nr:hypothetical protein [Photobacterium kishitanii]PSV00902.1 hypothetical protein C9J27_02425 [Photobacterium kishitanii]
MEKLITAKKGTSLVDLLLALTLLLISGKFLVSGYVTHSNSQKASHLAQNFDSMYKEISKAHPQNQEMISTAQVRTTEMTTARSQALIQGFDAIPDSYIQNVIKKYYKKSISEFKMPIRYLKTPATIELSTTLPPKAPCTDFALQLIKTSATTITINSTPFKTGNLKALNASKICSASNSRGIKVTATFCVPIPGTKNC